MNIADLKSTLETFQQQLKQNSGRALASSDNGPVTMTVINAMFQVIQSQEQRIVDLENRVAPAGVAPAPFTKL